MWWETVAGKCYEALWQTWGIPAFLFKVSVACQINIAPQLFFFTLIIGVMVWCILLSKKYSKSNTVWDYNTQENESQNLFIHLTF